MRIAQIAPIIERVPPAKYGGTERVVSALTEELVRRGHEVTLFASGDSQTAAKLHAVYPRALREGGIENPYDPANIWNLLNVTSAYEAADSFDLIHDHTMQNSPLSLPLASVVKVPTVMTLHGPILERDKERLQTFPKPYLVTISDAQAAPARSLHYAHPQTVYNGLDMQHYPFSSTEAGYLLFVGRISEEKGVHLAIHVARALQLPLLIAAKLDRAFASDLDYYHRSIEPELTSDIRWIGEVDEAERNQLMSTALCSLHPGSFIEPFGLTLIEAMACGCPVIAFPRGSIPEIIANGKSGFVVDDIEAMIEAVQRLDSIDRAACRQYALSKFSAERMADGYEAVYGNVLVQRDKHKSAKAVE